MTRQRQRQKHLGLKELHYHRRQAIEGRRWSTLAKHGTSLLQELNDPRPVKTASDKHIRGGRHGGGSFASLAYNGCVREVMVALRKGVDGGEDERFEKIK